MSYILDALRKADAQRERVRAPGLHAHSLAPAAVAPARSSRVLLLVGGAIAVGVASVLLVAWQMADDTLPIAQPAAQEAGTTPGAPVAAANPVPVAEPATAIVPPPPTPLPKPAEPERPATRAAPVEPRKDAAPAPAPAPVTVPVPQATAAAAAAAPSALASAAPAGAPALSVTGGVYSQNPAQRMLIVNGQVFNEGSEVAAGVTLEEVRPKQAVLKFRGQRFTLAY